MDQRSLQTANRQSCQGWHIWLYKFLYVVQIFILSGMVYYYFQESVGKTAPDHDIAGESSQPIGETLRPLWGLMDKCYPTTTQRRRVRSGKQQASKATPPKATGGLKDAAPKEGTDILPQDKGEVRSSGPEAACPTPAGKEVAEEKEVAGTPGCEGKKTVQRETALSPSEASAVESKEERPGGWVPQLLRKLRLGWFLAPHSPETQKHE
ncbi:PREDICTED: uncharacterized protein LOC107534996 [Miniopterus natalensis]|uniref:uncharacterized protein LOC107534996 n=1 Tax=Miniopterus natalensis TaxID=291302 RepID=UPI0007A6C17B|nr:PREDICTED: uncharacterized protein LOC107534996 [Miniopterus natalensis]